MKDEPSREKQVKTAAQFMITLIKMVKNHQELVTQLAVSNAALLQAVLETFPELAEPYERYRQASEADSPVVATSRQISARLDALTAQMKDEL